VNNRYWVICFRVSFLLTLIVILASGRSLLEPVTSIPFWGRQMVMPLVFPAAAGLLIIPVMLAPLLMILQTMKKAQESIPREWNKLDTATERIAEGLLTLPLACAVFVIVGGYTFIALCQLPIPVFRVEAACVFLPGLLVSLIGTQYPLGSDKIPPGIYKPTWLSTLSYAYGYSLVICVAAAIMVKSSAWMLTALVWVMVFTLLLAVATGIGWGIYRCRKMFLSIGQYLIAADK